MKLKKRITYITGLPRSGSTLLCQLLGVHPEVYSPRHSSPLLNLLTGMRRQLSQDHFMLSQLDTEFDLGYQRLNNVYRSVIEGWFEETNLAVVVDKNRGWLNQIDLVRQLDPEFRMLVCVREPGQIYGSVEAQHQKTILLDFPDNIADLSRYGRADTLFSPKGVIGAPLKALESVQDLDEAIQSHLYYVVFEHLMESPVSAMRDIFAWLGLPVLDIDPDKLPVGVHESDSYYRFKYPHRTRPGIQPPEHHEIPQRIDTELKNAFGWFYRIFYPGMVSGV